MSIIFISTREYSMFGHESYHYLFVLGTGDNVFREYFCKNEKFRETFVYKVSKFGDTVPIKGVGPEIFDLHFFHDSNSSRPLINMFEFGFDFAEKFDFAMCVAQRSQTFLLW